jgi:hypothetical protein
LFGREHRPVTSQFFAKKQRLFQLIEKPYGRSPTGNALTVGFFYQLAIFILVPARPGWVRLHWEL